MRLLNILLLITLAVLVCATSAFAENKAAPAEYGRVILQSHTKGTDFAPVVFDHWLHRSKFTCRLCHVDIGFAMKEGGTDITAGMNIRGFYCGACHNGKRTFGDKKTFASCAEIISPETRARCDRCHSLGKKSVRKYEFIAFTKKMPKTIHGSGIDWEKAESRGLIKPVDFLEGVSIRRPSLKVQKDFAIEAKAAGTEDVIFSHKKHAVWNGCEVCHPDIFPSVQKGATNYTMSQILEGRYCGVCHDKVAFPIHDCQRCHRKPVHMGNGAAQ